MSLVAFGKRRNKYIWVIPNCYCLFLYGTGNNLRCYFNFILKLITIGARINSKNIGERITIGARIGPEVTVGRLYSPRPR